MSRDLLLVLSLAVIPAAGNFAGGVLAELTRHSERRLNLALHGAAGLMIAIVAVEVMPEALQGLAGWWIALAFFGGGLAYVGLEAAVETWQSRREGVGSGPWMIYLAVSADLIGDGLLIGAGTAVSSGLGILLAVGQTLADVPEGFATTATFRSSGTPRSRRLLISASFVIPIVAAALFSYFLLRDRPESLKLGVLVFTAGLYTLAAVEEMLSQAHDTQKDTRYSSLFFLLGFALFTVVSSSFG